MSNALSQSWEISKELISVRYSNPRGAIKLLAKCNKWFEEFKNEEIALRSMLAGSRMLPSQLDLLDVAKERVRCVKLNCEQIAAKLS